MITDAPLTQKGKRIRRALWVTTPMASLCVIVTLGIWVFSTHLFLRRAALITCILTIVACMMILVVAKRGIGRVTLTQAYFTVLPTEGDASDQLPVRVPSGTSLRTRGLAGLVAFLAALVGVWALVASDDRSASTAAEIRAAGARIVQAPVSNVADVERYAGRGDTDYSATFTVLLRHEDSQGERSPVTLRARTSELPKEGSRLSVMYAPTDLQLGAVHGDTETLARLMRGRAMTPELTWGLALSWAGVAALVAGSTALTGGFRTVTRLHGTRAIRGTCAGSARAAQGSADGESMLIRNESHEHLHFWHERQASAIAEVAGAEPVWVCWEEPGAGTSETKKAPAVLIADSGWALHGEVGVKQVRALQNQTVAVGGTTAPTQSDRRVQVWNPVTSWPLLLRGTGMLWMVLALTSAAVCVTDFGVRWRWTIGIVCTVALLGLVASYVIPATRHVKGSLSTPYRAKALR